MKTKKLLATMLVVVLLFVFTASTFADNDTGNHYFNGSCYKHFTTNESVARSGNLTPNRICVRVTSLSFHGSPSYTYGMIKVVDQAGYQCEGAEAVSSYHEFDNITPRNASTEFKLKIFHPYFYDNEERASSSMEIHGRFNAIW